MVASQPDFELIAQEKTRAQYGNTVADTAWNGASGFFNSRVPGVWPALAEHSATDRKTILWPNGDNVAINTPSGAHLGDVSVPCKGHFVFRHHGRDGVDVVHDFSIDQLPQFRTELANAKADRARPGRPRTKKATSARHVLGHK